MKPRITITMLLLWILSSVIPLGTAFASPITIQQAQQNAMDFLKKKGKTVAKSALTDVSSKDATTKNYYVFNVGNNEGFVIASADDQVPAILGYANKGTVLLEAMPANLKAWLDSYDKQIRSIQEQGLTGNAPITSTHAAISPLMTTTWNQTDPYNQSCPDFFTYGKSVTGCVATAMAQVMYYHRNRSVNQIAATIPAYTCEREWNIDSGTKQISVESVPAGSVIDWDNMLTNYTGSETAVQKKAIADFMFYCGASVSMDYANRSSGGSAAYSEDVSGALKTYFGYSDNTQLVSRDNYTNDSWDNLIYNELSNNRPVFYSGVTSSGGGHAFVCDGYDSDGYYHINWGWGGYCDTYFLLSDLTPQDQGTGGSSGGYNNSQQALIGAEPSGNVTPPVQQYNVTLPGHTLYYINCYDRNNNLIYSNTEEGMTGGEPASFQCNAGSYLKLEIVWSGFADDSPSTPPTMYVNGNSIGNGQTFTINSLSSDIDVTVSLFKISCDIIGNGSVRITKNGSVISNNASIIDGDQITLELLPDAGYRLKKLEEHIPRMEMEVNELNVQNNTYSFSYSWNHFNGDAQFAAEFEEIPSVQKYTVSVNTTDSSLHIYDKNGNDITEDVHNGTKFDAGSYFHFVLEIGDAYYISEIKVNGVSVGQWNENNPNYEYVIENLTGDMAVEFTYETPIKYRTVYCAANGPGNVKMYKNGTYVGITTDNGSGYKVVSVVIDPTGSDEIKLEFIPDEGCKLSRLGHGFYDVDTETNDISNEISNNTYIIKYLNDEYLNNRSFAATFELSGKLLNVVNQDSVANYGFACIEVPALYYQPIIYRGGYGKNEAYYYIDKSGKKIESLDWRFNDGCFAPPITLPDFNWDLEDMDGYDYTGESQENTMWMNYNAWVEDFKALKTAKLVPTAFVSYRMSGVLPSLADFTFDLLTNTSVVNADVESRSTGYNLSMANNFVSPVYTNGSYYHYNLGFLQVPFKVRDWGKYVEDLAYYVSSNDGKTLKDSVNFISLQLTNKNDNSTIVSDEAAVIPAFLHINAIVDNGPENKILDCIIDDDKWPTKQNQNAGAMYTNAQQAINSTYTHTIRYKHKIDILPYIETHYTYIGINSNWDADNRVMDAETFWRLGLKYVFSIVDYEDGNHAAGESRHVSIDAKPSYDYGFGYDKVFLIPQSINYQDNGSSFEQVPATREAIGHEPLIKVEIIDPNNNVLYVGYIKLLITDEVDIDEGVIFDATNFPDPTFRAYISDRMGVLEGGTISNVELQSINSFYVYGGPYATITDLKGVEYFTALTSLSCENNQLMSLDMSMNTALRSLYCFNNQLTTLDVSKNTVLTHLSCGNNQLMSLDVSKNTALSSLSCAAQSVTLIAHKVGNNQYQIAVPSDFVLSKVSDFKVNDVMASPTLSAGHLTFSSSSTPQTIQYNYATGFNDKKMDVTVNITSIEEPNYDNTIYMDDMEVLSGTEAVLSVKMKNEVVAEGFEFDMYLPEGITVLQDEYGFPEVTLSTERTTARKTNSFDAIFNADGSLRVLAASTNGSAISGNDGEVVQVKVAIADDMAEGDYTACFKNIAISDENATSHTSAMTTSTIKVNTYIVGDANIDRKVDVADFTAVAHHLLNNTPQNFHMKAADANTDNRIDVGDLTAIAHLILYGTITKPTNTSGAKPFMMMDNGTPTDENYIYIEPVSVQGQSEVTLSVKMRNAVEAEGFEFDLYLPDGMSFVTDADGFAEVSLSTERTNSRKTNSFDSVIQEDGSLRVLAASTNGSSISGNDGEVALVTIHIDPNLAAAEYPLQLKNIAIADVNAVSHSTDLKESTITILYNGIITGIDGVDEMDDNADWYMLDGKKLNSKPKARGVYIMNGQKVVIK